MPEPFVFIRFCEPSYARFSFIAELWNTLSSFSYCIPAVYFWMLTNRYRAALPECFTSAVVWRYKLCAACWFILGFGSAAFHAFQTLWAELWDEIGMLVSILALSYCMIDLHPLTTSKRANWFYGTLFLAVLGALLLYIQLMYHPFFAATFIIAAFVPLLLSWTLPMNMNKSTVKFYEESTRGPSRATRTAKDSAKKISNSLSLFGSMGMNSGVTIGILISLIGYAVWHIDQKCLTANWKPSNPEIYELDYFYWAHPFWHVATAAGSMFIFDAMLKVRVDAFKSPLVRKPETGSFVPIYSFASSVKVLLGLRSRAQSS
jgi:hypothetical protein